MLFLNYKKKTKVTSEYKKKKIPAALRQQVWIQKIGKDFEGKCKTTWCSNVINVYTYECGHNIPESKGGKTDINNLVPICRQCNGSMGNQYTFDEWCAKYKSSTVVTCCSCFG